MASSQRSMKDRKVSPVSNSPQAHGDGGRPATFSVTPTPPAGRRPPSATSRPGSRSSRTSSRPGSVSSRGTASDIAPLSRQGSMLSPTTNELCYEYLPDVTKPVTTIGRYHTIVPPISQQNSLRPSSRPFTAMTEGRISAEFGEEDEHAISSVTEENTPASTPRLENPLTTPRYIQTPFGDWEDKPTLISENKLRELSSEPGEDEDRLRIAIRLPSGQRIERYFRPTDTLCTVLQFAMLKCDQSLTDYRLRMHQTKYDSMAMTLSESGIQDRTLLLLEPPD